MTKVAPALAAPRKGKLAKFDRGSIGVDFSVIGPRESRAALPAILPIAHLIELSPGVAKHADDGLGELERVQQFTRDFVETLIGQLTQ